MICRVGIAILLGLSPNQSLSQGRPSGDEVAEQATAPDCGISALYTLSRLVGRPIDLAEIRSRLPAARSGNYSMKELSDCALGAGLRLRGVLLDRRSEDAIDRPMLAFLNRGDHGHFLVVRPIGHTGKLVQLIDSINPPEVIDRSTLLAAPPWTGLVLMPEETRSLRLALRIATGSALAALLVWSFARRRRSASKLSPKTGLAPAGDDLTPILQ